MLSFKQFGRQVIFISVVSAWFMAATAMAHGDLDLRIAELTQRIATNPPNATLLLERAELHRLHLDWKAASEDLANAERIEPSLNKIKLARARLFADSGRLAESEVEYGAYLVTSSEDALAMIERARVRHRAGRTAEALLDYDRALELMREPEPDYFVERAKIQAEQGAKGKAIASLDAGMQRLGFLVVLQSFAVDLELERGETNAALERLESIIVRSKRPETWLERKGDILKSGNRSEDARQAFEACAKATLALPETKKRSAEMQELRKRVEANLESLRRGALTNKTASTR